MNGNPWYEQLRQQYRPQQVRVLLIAESPPASTSEDRRFFYSPHLTGHDNLFRGVALAAYGLNKRDLSRDGKAPVLRRLQSDGIWLIDAVDTPVNHLDTGARSQLIRNSVPGLIHRAQSAAPSVGVFICKAPLYDMIARSLEVADVIVLNRGPAPFPLGNTRAEFVNCWRRDVPAH
jgi:hypothetical protein